jgi:Uma2 family endonuclease
VKDYLDFEDGSNVKHEYFEGQIYAMAGGSPEHSALSVALTTLLSNQLRGGRCRVYNSDVRVGIANNTLITYPDAAVICGPVQRDPASESVVTNPTLLAEVLSPSTAEYDRTDKFDHYRHLATLRHYVLVDPKTRSVEVRSRTGDGTWDSRTSQLGEVVGLPAVSARLSVSDLFSMAAEPTD